MPWYLHRCYGQYNMKGFLIILFITISLAVFAQEKSFSLADTSFEVGSVYRIHKVFLTLCKPYERNTARTKAIVDSLTVFLNNNPRLQIEIGSHTDQRGSATYNLLLSEHEADSLKTLLVANRIKADRLFIKGYGESNPLIKQATIDNLETEKEKVIAYTKNIRFELKILKIK